MVKRFCTFFLVLLVCWQVFSQTTINFPVKSVTLVPGTSLINMYFPDQDGFDTIFISPIDSESDILQSLYNSIGTRVPNLQTLNHPIGFQLSRADSSFAYVDYGVRVDGQLFFHVEQISKAGVRTHFNLNTVSANLQVDLENNPVLRSIDFLSKSLNRDGFLNIYNTGKTANRTVNEVRDSCHLEWRFSGFSLTKAYTYFSRLSEDERLRVLQLLKAQLY